MKKPSYFRLSVLILLASLNISCTSRDGIPVDDSNTTTSGADKSRAQVGADYETASDAVANMKIGWNLGNTLESNSGEVNGWIEKYTDRSPTAYETSWGQPVATQALIHEFKKIGFNAIRVPVTWWPHLDNDTVINAAWMNRVEEVVNYVLNEGMYCIINIHHDTGAASASWLKADITNFTSMNAKYIKIWQQIAARFNKYGDHLLFESYNEMLDVNNTWNFPSVSTAYTAINQYAQTFVTTVRASGGNNAKRNLIVNTYCAGNGGTWGDCNKVLSLFVVPTDIISNHIAVEVHSYNPWNWDKDHGKWTTANASDISQMMSRLNTYFVNKGIPVIVGEYGAVNVDTSSVDQAEGAKYAQCVVSEAKKYNIATFYWMGLMDGKDRTALKWTQPKIVDGITTAYYGSDAISTGIREITMDSK